MRSVYALIPAALLAGTVLSVSADAKPRKIELGVHAQRLLAQKYVKTNITTKKSISFATKAKRRKTVKLASAKSRKLAAVKKRVAAQTVAPDVNFTSATPRKLVAVKKRVAAQTVAPDMNFASAKSRKLAALKKPKIARLAPAKKTVEMALAPKDDAPKPKLASFSSLSLTKTLPSAPRKREKLNVNPVAIAPNPAKVLEPGIKANESTGNYVTDVIRELAPSYGVPTWFALRIANVESGYNPYARGRAGEIGVYQLKCQTARGMGFEGNCQALTDARTNVRWGLKHLSLAIASSDGNLRLAASKHNGGLARKSLVHSYIAKVF